MTAPTVTGYRARKRADGYAGLKHGASTYSLGCKCRTCRAAGTLRKALWRERQKRAERRRTERQPLH